MVFGVRDPGTEKVRDLLDEAGPNASAAGVEEAASQGGMGREIAFKLLRR